FQKTSVYLLESCICSLGGGGKISPRLDVSVARRQSSIRGNYSHLELPSVAAFSDNIPAYVVNTAVPSHEVFWNVERCVCGAEREVEEERLLRRNRYVVAQELSGGICHVLREVVALLRRGRRWHGMIIYEQFRM